MKKIGITLGDPSGIGPEIVVKALTRNQELYSRAMPIVFGHPELIQQQADLLGVKLKTIAINDFDDLPTASTNSVLCYSQSKLKALPPLGSINSVSGQLAYEYIEAAIEKANLGLIDAIATAPLNKEALKKAQIPYLDHTQILKKLTNSPKPATLFITGKLRVFFLTKHLPFKDIAAVINKESIVNKLHDCNEYLQRINLSNPRLALAALNPHASDNGLFGDEEQTILQPAVEESRNRGINVVGPIAADSVFHLANEGHFDAVLSLYHDQGHIAAKTLDFYGTVSLTMGLPFLRTSVDHGTAMELAGKNSANATSMIAAINMAVKYAW